MKPAYIPYMICMMALVLSAPRASAAEFEERTLEGWTLYINRAALESHPELMEKTLAHLGCQLYQITRCLPPKVVDKLRTIPLWVEYETRTLCMSYHPGRQWLLDHDFDPPQVPSVIELGNAHNFLSWTRQQPWMVFHELAHGYNHLILAKGASYAYGPIDEAYARAMKKGIYEEVMHIVQKPCRHYAAENMMEYFAEGSEAFFGTNDFYPFVRAELKEADPHLHTLLRKLWETPRSGNRSEGSSPWYALRHKGCVTGWGGKERAGDAAPARPSFLPSKEYEYHDVQGFEVYVSPKVVQHEETAAQALKLLDHRLHGVAHMFPAAALEETRKTPIWVEYESREVAYVAYHASRKWLRAKGCNPDKAGAIEIGNVEKFLDWADLQPGLMIHLLAHAYHDRIVGFDDPYVKAAFEQAEEGGGYTSALRYDGKRDRHFALLNRLEYFAESSEAFFGTNDYYPFVQPELLDHDPSIYGLLEKLWKGMPRRK